MQTMPHAVDIARVGKIWLVRMLSSRRKMNARWKIDARGNVRASSSEQASSLQGPNE